MKKYLTLAAGATMLLGTAVGIALPATAHAQAAPATGAASGPFADVPADHWAYTAVNTLQKAGIVIGYPDGTYGGRRAMTRYEFAVAIARLLPQINNIDTSQFVKNGDFRRSRTTSTIAFSSSRLPLTPCAPWSTSSGPNSSASARMSMRSSPAWMPTSSASPLSRPSSAA